MRFVIFTPAIKTSAIGRMASLVTQALTKIGHNVVVVRTENTSCIQSQAHDFGAELVPWTHSEQVEDLVRGADALVYQVGNSYEFHQGCLEWLPRAPGVVCLHDFFLGHLFYGWATNKRADAVEILRSWYGDETARLFFSYQSPEDFIEATRDKAPMTEWIGSMAYGVVTHSNWGIQRVLDSCPGPVQVIPLAYDAPASATILKSLVKRESSAKEFNVLTVGHVNPNKRAESVIRAIGNSASLRERTTYRVVGHILPATAERLSTLAKSLQVKLVISGEVNSDTLLQAIGQADVICCLRWPSLEAASASAIEAMLYGKPVIVTDTGFYSELPDSCVRKIRVHEEVSDLQQALESLSKNESKRLALGVKAAKWATTTYGAENYANRLIDASLAAQRAAPMLKAIQSLTGVLLQWEASHSLITLSETTEPLRLFNTCHEAPPNSVGA